MSICLSYPCTYPACEDSLNFLPTFLNQINNYLLTNFNFSFGAYDLTLSGGVLDFCFTPNGAVSFFSSVAPLLSKTLGFMIFWLTLHLVYKAIYSTIQ